MALLAIIGITQLALGALGVWVSLRPPKREHHWLWIGGFCAIGLLGIVLTVIAGRNADRDQAKAAADLSDVKASQKDTNEQLSKANAALKQNAIDEAFMKGQLSGLSLMVGKIGTDSSVNSGAISKALLAIAKGSDSQGVQPPAIQRMTNKQLKSTVIAFANQMRALRLQLEQEFEEHSMRTQNTPSVGMSPEQSSQLFRQQVEENERFDNAQSWKISTTIIGPATEFRDELLRRIGPLAPSADIPSLWVAGGKGQAMPFFNDQELEPSANWLESLARQLPQ